MSVKVSTYIFDHHKDIKGNSLLILLAIADVVNHEGYGYICQREIAEKTRCDVRTIRRILHSLCARGILELIKRGDGRLSTTYQFHMSEVDQVQARLRYQEKAKQTTQDIVDRKPTTTQNTVPDKMSALDFNNPNVRPGGTPTCPPRADITLSSPYVHPITSCNVQPPSIPLDSGKTENSKSNENFSSPHPIDAPIGASLTAPTPLASGLSGAGAPLIDAAVSGSQPQGDITASAAMPEQPVIEVHAVSTQPEHSPSTSNSLSTNTPITGVHNVSKIANGKKNLNDWRLIARFNTIFERPAHYALSQDESRPLRHLAFISEGDLFILETVAKIPSARSCKWFPKTPRYLFNRWSYVVNHARKFLVKSQSSETISDADLKLSSLNRILRSNPHLDPDKTDNIDLIVAGSVLLEISSETLTQFLNQLTPEQINFLTTIKEKYAQDVNRIRALRTAKGNHSEETDHGETLADVA